MKISTAGTKTGTMSVNHHIGACPKAEEANCASFCYVEGTYVRHDNVENADLINLDIIQGLLATPDILAKVYATAFKGAKVQNLQSFRLHERGDFLTHEHFKAVMMACSEFPNTTFWAYTKSYHCVDMSLVPPNVKILISFSVNDSKLYRERALKAANDNDLPLAFASATREAYKDFCKEQNLTGFMCPEQALKEKDAKSLFKCVDCTLCWTYPKRFVVWFQAHGMYRGSFVDFVPKQKKKVA